MASMSPPSRLTADDVHTLANYATAEDDALAAAKRRLAAHLHALAPSFPADKEVWVKTERTRSLQVGKTAREEQGIILVVLAGDTRETADMFQVFIGADTGIVYRISRIATPPLPDIESDIRPFPLSLPNGGGVLSVSEERPYGVQSLLLNGEPLTVKWQRSISAADSPYYTYTGACYLETLGDLHVLLIENADSGLYLDVVVLDVATKTAGAGGFAGDDWPAPFAYKVCRDKHEVAVYKDYDDPVETVVYEWGLRFCIENPRDSRYVVETHTEEDYKKALAKALKYLRGEVLPESSEDSEDSEAHPRL